MQGPPESAPSRKVQARCCGDTFAWSGPGRPRAWLGGLLLLGGSAATAQVPAPIPAAARLEPSAPPPTSRRRPSICSRPVKSGELIVTARGQGQDKVRMTLRNTGGRRLNVIVPPGLVASSKVAQGRRRRRRPRGRRPAEHRARLGHQPRGRVRRVPGRRRGRRPPLDPRDRRDPLPVRRRPGRRDRGRVDPRRLPQLRPRVPEPARQAHHHGRGLVYDRRQGPQGAPLAGHDGDQPRRGPGGHVAASAMTCRSRR